jgi:ribonucleotide monophosphatase NagD (HAD superfamily)
MRQTICIDLNGVLDTYRGWQGYVSWHPPRAGAAEFLHALRQQGFRVVVLTARAPDEARQWLDEHGLASLVDEVTNQKPSALAYVDDRAVCFRGDFAETLECLRSFEPHWRGETHTGAEEG